MSVEHGLTATLAPPLGAALVPTTRRVAATTPIAGGERGTGERGAVSAGVWTATGLERQVFLAHNGRRRRGFAALGALLALLAAVWMTALTTGSVGFSSLPALPSATANVAPSQPPARRGRVVRVAARRHAVKVADAKPAALGGGALGRLSTRKIQLD